MLSSEFFFFDVLNALLFLNVKVNLYRVIIKPIGKKMEINPVQNPKYVIKNVLISRKVAPSPKRLLFSDQKNSNPKNKAIMLNGSISNTVRCCNFSYFRIKNVVTMNIIVITVPIQSLCAKAPTMRIKKRKNIDFILLTLVAVKIFKFIFRRSIIIIVIIILVLTVIVVS